VIVWKTNFDSEAEEEPENKQKKKSVGRPASARPGSTRPGSARSNRPATASGFRSRKAFSEQTNTPEVRTLGPPIAGSLPDPQLNSTQENITHPLEDQKLPKNVEKVMQEMVRQMDVLTQTVAILEQRLYNMEGKLENQNLKKQIDSLQIDTGADQDAK